MKDVKTKATEAERAALKLSSLSEDKRNEVLQEAASLIGENSEKILEANREDVKEAEKLLKKGEYSKALVKRLKLTESKIDDIAKMIRSVSRQKDPLNQTIFSRELDDGLKLYKTTAPIGVIGIIFESRPDVLPQISSLCLKSGNAVILKGGSEAEKSNKILYDIFKEATKKVGISTGWIQLIEARKEVRELLDLDDKVDLLIPRGSKDFVRFIQDNSKIPILGHTEGLCHIYVDKFADVDKAVNICYDGKTNYPAACNAAETLLLHKDIASEVLPELAKRFEEVGVEIRGCPETRNILKNVKEATEEDWKTEYLDLIISIKVVDSISEAIDHVNNYGSKHTDSIVSEKDDRILNFVRNIDSSSVMANASTRFSDGYRYGLGAEVGISTGKIHARGPVGLEGLTTSKYYLIGDGHIVDTYTGADAKAFTHIDLEEKWADIENSMKRK